MNNDFFFLFTNIYMVLLLFLFSYLTNIMIIDYKDLIDILISINIKKDKDKNIWCSYLGNNKIRLTKKDTKIIKKILIRILDNKCIGYMNIEYLNKICLKYNFSNNYIVQFYFSRTKRNKKIIKIVSIISWIYFLLLFLNVFRNIYITITLLTLITLIVAYQFLLYIRISKYNFGCNFNEGRELIYYVLENYKDINKVNGKMIFNNELENEIYAEDEYKTTQTVFE